MKKMFITIGILAIVAGAVGYFSNDILGSNPPGGYVSYERHCLDVGGSYGKEISKANGEYVIVGTCLMNRTTLYRGETIPDIQKQVIR